MRTSWDYTDRSHTYDKRADYSTEAVLEVLSSLKLSTHASVADIGAGTGKLTKILAPQFSSVFAIEPNDSMRLYGTANVSRANVKWSKGTAENTGLENNSVEACFFGSSFNVVDDRKSLAEVKRILKSNGWFVCMWNHRDTSDELQSGIEQIILHNIPNYDYGSRRQDPSQVLLKSGMFEEVFFKEQYFHTLMARADVIDAWKSHDTLFRQAGEKFPRIIDEISEFLITDTISVPYFTRIWYCQLSRDS